MGLSRSKINKKVKKYYDTKKIKSKTLHIFQDSESSLESSELKRQLDIMFSKMESLDYDVSRINYYSNELQDNSLQQLCLNNCHIKTVIRNK